MLARYHQRSGPAVLGRKDFLEITSCGTNLAGVIIGKLQVLSTEMISELIVLVASFWILKQANGLKKLPRQLTTPPSPPWVHAQPPAWSENNAVSV